MTIHLQGKRVLDGRGPKATLAPHVLPGEGPAGQGSESRGRVSALRGRWGTEAKANLLSQNKAVTTVQVPRHLDQVFVLV